MYDTTAFNKMLSDLDISLKDDQTKQFLHFYDMLMEKNKVMNLTAITEFEEVVSKHFIDSLSLKKVFNTDKALSVIDMGTGAGFPGIPLKIAFPHWNIVLLDSLNKRVNFLNEVIDALGLKEIKAVHGRAEDYGRQSGCRESFDLCVSRAVAKLATLSEYCLPYVKINGCFISYKACSVQEEIAEADGAVRILGGAVENTCSFFLPDSDIKRSLIVIRKQSHTPGLYPRSAGKPSKEPLPVKSR